MGTGWTADAIANKVPLNANMAIKSSRGGFLQDAGGWVGAPGKATDWQVMQFQKLPF